MESDLFRMKAAYNVEILVHSCKLCKPHSCIFHTFLLFRMKRPPGLPGRPERYRYLVLLCERENAFAVKEEDCPGVPRPQAVLFQLLLKEGQM